MLFDSLRTASAEIALSHDDDFVQQVVCRLQSRLGSPVLNLQLVTRNGGLILRGQVRSHYGKQMVQEVVMQFSDSSILSNDIEVQCGMGP